VHAIKFFTEFVSYITATKKLHARSATRWVTTVFSPLSLAIKLVHYIARIKNINECKAMPC
jgi:hypothetical protein